MTHDHTELRKMYVPGQQWECLVEGSDVWMRCRAEPLWDRSEQYRQRTAEVLDNTKEDEVHTTLPADPVPPWKQKPLDEWAIVTMHHTQSNNPELRWMYVVMMKDGHYIAEEGKDDKYLWNRLWHKAFDYAKREEQK